MEYKEGSQYDIAECESKEAGPSAAILTWRALDESGREISDSSIFSACSNGDDSNFCGKTNGAFFNPYKAETNKHWLDYFLDKKDKRALQTTTLPLGFTADNFGGINSDFDKTHFYCVATYKEAVNGELLDINEKARWPEDKIRVLREFCFLLA